jgi:hypothetical protein
MTRETVFFDTPAIFAMSLIVSLPDLPCAGVLISLPDLVITRPVPALRSIPALDCILPARGGHRSGPVAALFAVEDARPAAPANAGSVAAASRKLGANRNRTAHKAVRRRDRADLHSVSVCFISIVAPPMASAER